MAKEITKTKTVNKVKIVILFTVITLIVFGVSFLSLFSLATFGLSRNWHATVSEAANSGSLTSAEQASAIEAGESLIQNTNQPE